MKLYQIIKGHRALRAEDPAHRDEKYRARILKLCATTTYDTCDLKVPIPSRRNMNVPFNPDRDDHWVIRPDLGNLWYARICFDLDPFAEDFDYDKFLRDEKWTVMDNEYGNSKWRLSVTHRPYDKRKALAISGLSRGVGPKLDVTRWRNRVDEDCFIFPRIPFTLFSLPLT